MHLAKAVLVRIEVCISAARIGIITHNYPGTTFLILISDLILREFPTYGRVAFLRLVPFFSCAEEVRRSHLSSIFFPLPAVLTITPLIFVLPNIVTPIWVQSTLTLSSCLPWLRLTVLTLPLFLFLLSLRLSSRPLRLLSHISLPSSCLIRLHTCLSLSAHPSSPCPEAIPRV